MKDTVTYDCKKKLRTCAMAKMCDGIDNSVVDHHEYDEMDMKMVKFLNWDIKKSVPKQRDQFASMDKYKRRLLSGLDGSKYAEIILYYIYIVLGFRC